MACLLELIRCRYYRYILFIGRKEIGSKSSVMSINNAWHTAENSFERIILL